MVSTIRVRKCVVGLGCGGGRATGGQRSWQRVDGARRQCRSRQSRTEGMQTVVARRCAEPAAGEAVTRSSRHGGGRGPAELWRQLAALKIEIRQGVSQYRGADAVLMR
jgi:hypothetical protein